MVRSLRGNLDLPPRLTHVESKTIEKYATLPRRKKEKDKSSERPKEEKKTPGKKSSKDTTSKMFSSLYASKPKVKTKIYHEMNIQTALTMWDIEQALAGSLVSAKSPEDRDKCSKDVQVDIGIKEMDKLKEEMRCLTDKYELLIKEHKDQTEKLKETEDKLKEEILQKEGLREELNNNSHRVLAILGQAGESESQGLSFIFSLFASIC